ncbi:MAG: hypothetical protein AAFQ36_12615 [Pseudomonadota bacterium]
MRTLIIAAILGLCATATLAEGHGPEEAEKRNLAQRFIALNLLNQTPEIMGGLSADPVIEQLRVPYPDITAEQEAEVRLIFGTAVAEVNRSVMLENAKDIAAQFTVEELRALVAMFEDETNRAGLLALTNAMTSIQPALQARMREELLSLNGEIIGVFEPADGAQ